MYQNNDPNSSINMTPIPGSPMPTAMNVNPLNPMSNTGSDWFSNAFGSTDKDGNKTSGWLSPVAGAGSALAQSWLGMQNLGLARDQYDFTRNAWQQQFDIQKAEYDYQVDRREQQQANYDAYKAEQNQRTSAASTI